MGFEVSVGLWGCRGACPEDWVVVGELAEEDAEEECCGFFFMR